MGERDSKRLKTRTYEGTCVRRKSLSSVGKRYRQFVKSSRRRPIQVNTKSQQKKAEGKKKEKRANRSFNRSTKLCARTQKYGGGKVMAAVLLAPRFP